MNETYICNELTFRNSNYGKTKLARIQDENPSFQVDRLDYQTLLDYYLQTVSIPETYITLCYERLLDYGVKEANKEAPKIPVPVPIKPIWLPEFLKYENIKKAIKDVAGGVGDVFDYLLIALIVIAVLIAIYLITNFLKTTKA